MSISIAQANAMLGGLAGTLYVQPHSGDPGTGGSNVIIGATRGIAALASAAGGTRTSIGNTDCPGIPQGTTVTHLSYWDSLAAGVFQFSVPLTASIPFTYAGTLRLTTQTFSLATSEGSSQTTTSINADSTAASDSNVTTRILVHTDTATASDSASAAVGIFTSNTDTASTSDSHLWAFILAHADTATTSDENTASAGGGFVDTFSSFDTNRWQKSEADNGTATIDGANGLRIYVPSTTDAACVALKDAVSLKATQSFSVDTDNTENLSSNGKEVDIWGICRAVAWPGCDDPANFTEIIRVGSNRAADGIKVNVYYWNASGSLVTLVNASTACAATSTVKRWILETTATQWRIRVVRVSDSVELLASSWVNWTSTRDVDAAACWFQFGRFFYAELGGRDVTRHYVRYEYT